MHYKHNEKISCNYIRFASIQLLNLVSVLGIYGDE